MLALLTATTALTLDNKHAAAPALRLRGGVSFETSTLNLAAAVYHASFGAALYSDPNAFAPSGASPLKYTEDAEGPVGKFTARSFGAMMLGMGSIGLFDKESEGVTKMFAIVMALFSPILAANTKEDSAGAGHTQMWKLQSLLHVPFTALMVYKAFFDKKSE